jgi:mRNA-degrading endonuclease RelE of RelBE toxin-antitoxin system
MQFLIADTFTASLAKLNGDEQKQVKTSAFDLQMNPANPGLQFHKLNAARDPKFWSVRVNRDVRIIVHRSENRLLLCYVDHHDKAYKWGERRKLETHPKTGAAQIVEVRETVQEIIVPTYVEQPKEALKQVAALASFSADELLNYGVPTDWIDDVLAANEDQLLEIVDHLPAEAAEAVLELAVGGVPAVALAQTEEGDPFEHPDAFRRFRVMEDVEALEQALDYPWERWTVFLHPAQQSLVEKTFNGPAKVAGSAGTGKTIVALHRALHLAKTNQDARILLTTFSEPLARSLSRKLRILAGNQPRVLERIEVSALKSVAARMIKSSVPEAVLTDKNTVSELLKSAIDRTSTPLPGSEQFILNEWLDVIDAWQLSMWDDYKGFKRLGRKTRLSEAKRAALWSIFEEVQDRLKESRLMTSAAAYFHLAATFSDRANKPFDYIVIDEAQDISPMQLKFVGAMAEGGVNNLFFAGDLGQRIFQTPFSWSALGVQVRGRSSILRINYRTSHQIRMQADLLLDKKISDVDGNEEDRSGTVSVFNSLKPIVEVYDDESSETEGVAEWIGKQIEDGASAGEIGVFVRSTAEISRAERAIESAGLDVRVLNENSEPDEGFITVSTMHLAKGLEFRFVVVMACDDEVIPSQERIEAITDQSDLDEVYNTERHLLYVACTRARDGLLVCGSGLGSEFLDDLGN